MHLFVAIRSAHHLHPRKLTCPLKRDYFSREYIFQPLIFRGQPLVFQGVVGNMVSLIMISTAQPGHILPRSLEHSRQGINNARSFHIASSMGIAKHGLPCRHCTAMGLPPAKLPHHHKYDLEQQGHISWRLVLNTPQAIQAPNFTLKRAGTFRHICFL